MIDVSEMDAMDASKTLKLRSPLYQVETPTENLTIGASLVLGIVRVRQSGGLVNNRS